MPDPREIVEEAEILKVAEENRNQIRVNYLGETAVFRAAVMLKLKAHDAFRPGLTWAIFREPPDDSLLVEAAPKETLIIMMTAASGPETGRLTAPLVRLVTNEILMTEAGPELLSEDVTVDPKNNALYYVNGTEIGNGEIDDNTLASIFQVKEGRLSATTPIQKGTLIHSIPGIDGPITPFGDGRSIEDRLYAFDKAREMFAAIEHLEPAFTIDNCPD